MIMRVLMLSWEYPPNVVGGMGTHVGALVPAMARRGVQLSIITPRLGGGDPESRVEPDSIVHRVEPTLPPSGEFFATVKETNQTLEAFANTLWRNTGDNRGLQEGRFDLIHAHDWLAGFAAVGLKRQHKVPLVVTMHATERGRRRGHLPEEISQAIDQAEWSLTYEAWRVITVSNNMSEEVRKFFNVPENKITVIPNGVDASRFDSLHAADLSGFRRRWARDDERIVLFVGRMEYQKGPQVLVEAAPLILSQFPAARFILAGKGGLERDLDQRVSELGLGDKVRMAGFLPDADRDMLYRVADVAVFPSIYEPFGIVALEAMAAKCPVVVSDVGGLGEIVVHNETGLLVNPDNVLSLAWGVIHSLSQPDWSAARAASAYRIIRGEYDWGAIAERTIELYRQVIAERQQVEW